MVYGPITLAPKPPPPQRAELILLAADRFDRSAAAMQEWSERAKECVDFFEDKQWSANDLALLEAEGRPALTLNKVKPLVNLVVGYHLNNRTDIRYLPGYDGTGIEPVSTALTQVEKQIAENCKLKYVDAEVFLDGLLTGRGFYDSRLSFTRNDLGEVITTAQDPFATYVPPDAYTYDPREWPYIITSRMVSLEEVEVTFGEWATYLVGPLVGYGGFSGTPADFYGAGHNEVTPWRTFGGEQAGDYNYWRGVQERFYEWVDLARKTIRLIDMQHYIRVPRWYFIDLETGDRAAIPDSWIAQGQGDARQSTKVQLCLAWSQQKQVPLTLTRRVDRRLRWSIFVGDVCVYDDWSPYETMTVTPFFPYFRRGQTKGMVDSLRDPQREINKRRSARLNIIMRAANGGWMYEKGSLDPVNKEALELSGGRPGIVVEYNKGFQKPEQIAPAVPPEAMRQLEMDAEDDIKFIAGVNEDALGTNEKVQSGRAIEAKQRQSIVGLEMFMSNYSRSKQLIGDKHLELIQQHYTEPRIIRIEGAKQAETAITAINQVNAAGQIVNDVTLGRYKTIVDETPLSASFLDGQFNELMQMVEKGLPIPMSFIVDASSIGRKDELVQEMQEAAQAQAQAAAAAGAAGAPGASPGGKGAPPSGGGKGPAAAPPGPPPTPLAPLGQPGGAPPAMAG